MNATKTAKTTQQMATTPAGSLVANIEALREGQHYKNYLRVREAVLACLDEMDQSKAAPSAYWREEVSGFDYMFDASPLIVEKLREHCYHLTGIASYAYRGHHLKAAKDFAKKLARLAAIDGSNLFVPESPILGGYGHDIEGGLVNVDTLKFYECMLALDKGGFLDSLKADVARKEVWLEIGAGWGGFAYTAKTRFPKITYVIVDLPQTLLFSATYLMSAFPEARIALYPEVSLSELSRDLGDYDFVFIPHYLFPQAAFRVDLAVNTVSFQEMTSEQVAGYVAHLAAMGCPRLYSLNKDLSDYNPELSSITDLIETNYGPTRRIPMFEVPYTTVFKPKVPPRKRFERVFGRKPKKPPRDTDYRHLVAERRA